METLAAEVPELLGRSLLPVAKAGRTAGTAFVFNYLIRPEPDGDVVATFLTTTLAVADGELAELGLPDRMISPPGVASDLLLFTTWSDQWLRPDPYGLDLALLPFVRLREHGQRKGWEWRTQEVTDGMLLQPGEALSVMGDEIAAYGFAERDDSGLPSREPLLWPVEPRSRWDGSVGFAADPALLPGALIVALAPSSDGFARFVVVGMLGAADADQPRPFTPGPQLRAGARAALAQLQP